MGKNKMIKLINILKEVIDKSKPILTKRSSGGKTLILIPGSGGDGGGDFKNLVSQLVKTFTIYTADFNADAVDVRKYAEQLSNEINNNPDIKDFAIGGYSIGGSMAWHVARVLGDNKKFKKKLFWIDSGVPNSTEEFAANLPKSNPPRYAIAQPLSIFKKNREVGKLLQSEEEQIKVFFKESELKAFMNDNKGRYIEYLGNNFPPSNNNLDTQAKEINQTNPWIIEDKFDKTNFKIRFSDMVKIGAKVEGKTFKEGDPIIIQRVQKTDTLKKQGLGRETGEKGKILPALSGVEIISLLAANQKDGKEKSQEDKEESLKQLQSSTQGGTKQIFIPGSTHNNILEDPKVVAILSKTINSNW
jgi:hypothetical protein